MTNPINLDVVEEIVKLKNQGLSSRDIASLVGCSKSTVNNVYNRNTYTEVNSNFSSYSSEGPKILIFDLETAPSLSYTFGRWKQNISQDAIAEEGGWIICATYKWLGDSEVHTLMFPKAIAFRDDSHICMKLWDLYEQADAVVAHNAIGFDHKILQGRCLVNNLPPLPAVKVLDTLQMAKKNFRLNSNKLDSIAQVLELGSKNQTGGISLWINTLEGDTTSQQKMLEYCKQDTLLLEQVFLKLRVYGQASNFNASHYYKDNAERCPVCGSLEVEETGRSVFTDVSEFAEVQCQECHAVHRKRKPLNNKEKRQAMLTAVKI